MCYSESYLHELQNFIALRGLIRLGLSFSLVFGTEITESPYKFYLGNF